MENLRIYVATYNVGTSNPDAELQPLGDLLSLTPETKTEKLPDFYVLSFQEIKAQPQNMLLDSIFDDPWTTECSHLLNARNYIKLKAIRLQGLLLVVYCLRKHLLNIREIESEYTRTGLAGMWGNKGAVSIRLSIYGCAICFVNSHLSAHDDKLKDRIEDYNSIIKDQEFHVQETNRILFHDYVIWMGDLNFRLAEKYDKTPEEIERSILKKDLKALFEHDQLRYVIRSGTAFSELIEQDPEFPPTFKFEVGTSSYNYKRRPAWCDRILYTVSPDNYENVTLKIDQLSYKSHPFYVLSDHKPVTAEFIVKIPKAKLSMVDQVFSDFSERVIEFENIPSWNEKDENKAIYKVTREIVPTKEDWIGLFKENFGSLDEYVVYEYVSKCSSPTSTKPTNSTTPNRSTNGRFEVTFSELPNHCKGNYCLVYFSQTEDKVSSVLGISNAFPIIKEDSD